MIGKINIISLMISGALAQGDVYLHPRLELERETEIISEEFGIAGYEKILFVYDTQVHTNDFDPSIKNEPMLLGYFNVTVEDTSEWPDGKWIRMCLQIWDEDQNRREQIRFVNQHTVADEDHNVIIPEFEVQFSYTSPEKSDAPDGDDQDNMKNLNYFCSRPSDWGGIITELDDPNENKSEPESQSSESGGDDDTL